MRRLVLVLGLLAAAALLCVVVLVSVDEPAAPGTGDDPAPAAPVPPLAPDTPVAPAPVARAAEPPPAGVAPDAAPPLPVGRGRLACRVEAERPGRSAPIVRLTVLWPTGEVIATAAVASRSEHTFENLPHGVPLVLRAAAPGFFTGLCCDVRIDDGGRVVKSIRMLPAPRVTVRLAAPRDGMRYAGVRVDAVSAGGGVASAVTSETGEAQFDADLAGRLRLLVSGGPFPAPREFVRDVWPTEGGEPILLVVEIAPPETVEIAVLDADGRPAAGVPVWLVGEFSPRPPRTTGRDGVAVFTGVEPSNVLTAVARASDGFVAAAPVGARTVSSPRLQLMLSRPQPLTGDVVDEGGSVVVGARVEVVVRPFDEPVTATSDDTGRFETAPLPAGLAEVVVRRAGFLDWRSPQPVAISRGEGGAVRARMTRAPTGRVFVRVRDPEGGSVEGATVLLHPSRLSARTFADGTCRIDDVPAGTEQTVFVRRPGWSVQRGAAWTPRVVRIPAYRGVDTEVVLERRGAAVPVPGGGALAGVVLGPSMDPVVGAAVECGTVRGFTGSDGRFRLDGIRDASPGEPLEFRVLPGPGMLEPLRFHVDAEELGRVELGRLRLFARPYALVAAPAGPPVPSGRTKEGGPARPGGPPSPAFWLASNHADTLLGVRHDAFEPYACVSYDGAWLHLPPADDWRTDGRGEVFVAYPSWRGLMTATAAWTLAPDAAATLAMSFDFANGRIGVDLRGAGRPDVVRFEQVRCGTLFDPRSVHVPTGDEQSPRDPFASLAGFRTFTVERARGFLDVDDVAPGRWRVAADGTQAWAAVPGRGRVVLTR